MARYLKHIIPAVFAAILFCAANVYASGVLDVNYVNCLRPYVWDDVPANTFEDSGISGTYKILLDKENGCFYLTFFIYEPSAVEGADESDVRVTVDIKSPSFTEKQFEFANGEQPEEESDFNVVTKSSAEFSQMDNAGQNTISGYIYAGFFFEKETERTIISVTANYSCGDVSKTIFKDVSLDMTCDYKLTETQTVVQTQTVAHTSLSSGNIPDSSEKVKLSDEEETESTEETKYTGKAVLRTTETTKSTPVHEETTKYTGTVQSTESTSHQISANAETDTAVQGESGMSKSSIALLCIASVLCTGGIGAVVSGIIIQAKNSAGKGVDKNE